MCKQQEAAVHSCHILSKQPDNLVVIYQYTNQTLKLTENVWDSLISILINLHLVWWIKHVNKACEQGLCWLGLTGV